MGQQLSAYHLEAILGSGGMATVYRARTPHNEWVALKVLFPPAGLSDEINSRFEREALTATRLNHPAIVPVLDVGHDRGHAFMAMSLIEGHSLDVRLRQVGPLTETEAADIAWQMADALDYAHSQNVIHRDVKPANILLTADNRAYLTDFGIALALDAPALTRTGYIVGTPAYISPEQAAGQHRVDGRADLYALGVVLYEMVTGQAPFQGGTPQVLHAHVYDRPPAPSGITTVSPAIESVILQALAKEADHRFATGAAMAGALARLGTLPPTRTDHLPPTRTMPGLVGPPPQPATPPPAENPFFYGGAVTPERFYGRQDLVQTVIQRLGGRVPQSVSIVGERRMGKSSLLAYLRAGADRHFSPRTIIIYLDLMKAYCHSRAGLMRLMRRVLTQQWREPWAAAEDGDLMAFDFALEALQADGWRLLLFLDEVENLTQRAEEFNDVLEDWRACAQVGQMGILAASAQPLADLCASGGLTSPFYNIFAQHRLPLLTAAEWHALVTDHLDAGQADLTFIEKVAGGHPFLTQMAASYLWQAKQNGEVDYDRLYQTLWEQAAPHLHHLWRGLTATEQTTLRRAAGVEPDTPDATVLALLERRGLTSPAGQPFSPLFAEMIRREEWAA